MKHLMMVLFGISLLTACTQGNVNQPNPPQNKPSSSVAELPDKPQADTQDNLDRSNALLGTDSDDNGIRDDIDTYIAKKFTDPVQKKVVEKIAKSMQKSLTVGKIADEETRRLEAKKLSLEMDKNSGCIFYLADQNPNFDDNIILELESLTTNTKPRLLAYLAYDKALDGTVSTLMDEKESCDE
ncbi:hypothetical protein MOMA_07886 [Moraxella macacae 0408225]|uniref:Lipoprotein n=1 Tax=Moraxella macacae 0408225 TaxID=1230338 RepID=L2F6C1_9GAMM|nr:hypothetical protein [Moraxella macacae]ELA08465.1 hypothetical protein MOMA_07886 [Moraxella macacae 0408225]